MVSELREVRGRLRKEDDAADAIGTKSTAGKITAIRLVTQSQLASMAGMLATHELRDEWLEEMGLSADFDR